MAAPVEWPTKRPSGPDQETSLGSHIRFWVAFSLFSAFHLDLDSQDPGDCRRGLGCAASCREEDKYQHVASGLCWFLIHSIELPLLSTSYILTSLYLFHHHHRFSQTRRAALTHESPSLLPVVLTIGAGLLIS